MSAMEQAASLYDDVKEFYQIDNQCLTHGVVVSSPDVFIAGSYVELPHPEIKVKKKLDKGVCFFVYIGAGKINCAFDVVEKADYIAWERSFDGKTRLIPFDRLRRLLDYGFSR